MKAKKIIKYVVCVLVLLLVGALIVKLLFDLNIIDPIIRLEKTSLIF